MIDTSKYYFLGCFWCPIGDPTHWRWKVSLERPEDGRVSAPWLAECQGYHCSRLWCKQDFHICRFNLHGPVSKLLSKYYKD